MNKHVIYRLIGLLPIVVMLTGLCTMTARAAIAEGISYQGYLTDDTGSPVDTPVSVTFSLYNVAAGGVPLWSDAQLVTTSNGLFSVQLGDDGSFPVGLFAEPLWLGITVVGDAEMLPRRPVLSAGYAYTADDAFTLEGFSASSLDQSAHVTDLLNPHNVTAAQIDAASAADLVLHVANPSAHHTKTTRFFELTDVATDDQIPSTITRDSELGLHASDDSAHHYKTISLPWADITSKPAGFADNVDNDSGGDITAVYGGYGLNGGGTTGAVTLNVNVPFWLAGSVADGTGVIRGTNLGSSTQGHLATSNSGVYGFSGVTDGHAVAGYAGNQALSGVYGQNTRTAGRGVYGLATADTSGIGVYGRAEGTSGSGVYGYAPALSGITNGVSGNSSSSDGRGVFGSAGSGKGVYGYSVTGTAGHFVSLSGYGLIVGAGNTGLGALNPNSMLHVNGDGEDPSFRAQVDGATKLIVAANGGVGIGGNLETPAARLQVTGGTDATLSNGSGYEVVGSEGGLNLVIDDNEIMARSNGNPSRLYLNRDSTFVVVPGLEITGGADLVEPFNVQDEDRIEPGMVLAIDPENPGKLRIADDDYDRTVAGIVSGANGISPGLSMSHQGTQADGTLPVALTGRLFALADADYGAIQPGDLLTTSRTPGHVMKVTDYSRAHGSIIGKAMTALDEGRGYVLVLVSLQ